MQVRIHRAIKAGAKKEANSKIYRHFYVIEMKQCLEVRNFMYNDEEML